MARNVALVQAAFAEIQIAKVGPTIFAGVFNCDATQLDPMRDALASGAWHDLCALPGLSADP
eukprot:1239321-Alexandrium_andersonii.AAC.1